MGGAANKPGRETADTARGHHFSTATAIGSRVRKGEPIAGLAHSVATVALPLFDAAGVVRPQAESDSLVLGAIDEHVADGRAVNLQIMHPPNLSFNGPSQR